MCGIVGILNFDKSKIDLNELERFNNSLKHKVQIMVNIYKF